MESKLTTSLNHSSSHRRKYSQARIWISKRDHARSHRSQHPSRSWPTCFEIWVIWWSSKGQSWIVWSTTSRRLPGSSMQRWKSSRSLRSKSNLVHRNEANCQISVQRGSQEMHPLPSALYSRLNHCTGLQAALEWQSNHARTARSRFRNRTGSVTGYTTSTGIGRW